MDTNKIHYFLAKYRSEDRETLLEAHQRLDDLADEAAEALRTILDERQITPEAELGGAKEAATNAGAQDTSKQTELSTELWNSSLSKHFQFMVSAQALMFSVALMGPQGLRLGVLGLLLVAIPLSYAGMKLGRRWTRNICGDAEVSIALKRRKLRNIGLLLPN